MGTCQSKANYNEEREDDIPKNAGLESDRCQPAATLRVQGNCCQPTKLPPVQVSVNIGINGRFWAYRADTSDPCAYQQVSTDDPEQFPEERTHSGEWMTDWTRCEGEPHCSLDDIGSAEVKPRMVVPLDSTYEVNPNCYEGKGDIFADSTNKLKPICYDSKGNIFSCPNEMC